MKRKLTLSIIMVFLITTLVACQKKSEATNTNNDVGETKVTTTEESNADHSNENSEEPEPTNVVEEANSISEDKEGITSQVDTLYMTEPPFEYYLSDKVNEKAKEPIALELKKSNTNQITDDDAWFANNNLSLNTYQVPNRFQETYGNLPELINTTWNDLLITKAFYDDSYIYCTYGADYSEGYILNIYDAKSMKIMYNLDFSSYRYSPDFIAADYDYIQQRIMWATIKDNILYVSNSHNTYAKSSNYMNSYITAINLDDMSILWRTDALVCNSYNFVIADDVIISGYGFTDEPDYLYQIDINTGKVLDKTSIKTAASYLVKKDNVLYVRTYNTDYEFDIIQ